MNRWKGINEFVAVVEAGSFSKAADNLGVGVSQISKRVTDLESRLGVRLIHRSTRLVKPSKQGEIYYHSCKKILAEFERAEDDLAGEIDAARGKIKIAYIGGSRAGLQVEILASFIKRYPEITIEVVYLDEMTNLMELGVDVALAVGDPGDSNYEKLRMAWVDYYLCASPAFLEEYPEPHSPEALTDIPCIEHDAEFWRITNGERHVDVDIAGPWKSLNMRSCIEAAAGDLGVFMVPNFTLAEYEKSGRLRQILPGWYVRKPLWCLYPDNDYVPVKIELLKQFLKDVLGFIADGEEVDIAPSFNADSVTLYEEFAQTIVREDQNLPTPADVEGE